MTSATSVLIVEDEGIVALDISARLEKLNYQVVGVAATGQTAINYARELRPDVILMDIQLSGDMDGIETTNKIQAELDIPVIYLTAYADESTLQQAKITTPYGYLLKPFEERELHATIAMTLYKHQMEQRLKENEQWLSTTLHSIAEAVLATDSQGCITFMNPAAETLTGWTGTEARGQMLETVFKVVDEKTGQPATTVVTDLLQHPDKQTYGPLDQQLVNRNGQKITINSRAAIISNKRQVLGVVLTFRDITEERATQAKLRQQEKLAAVGQLAAGVAHEFNNILTGMIGFAELSQNYSALDKTIFQNLGQIITLGQRAAHLVQQILDFSRKSPIQKQILNPASFLTHTIHRLANTITTNIDINIDINPRCGQYQLHADPNQIEQALYNVMANAEDAMPDGGRLTLKADIVPNDTAVSPPTAEDWLKITISDTGFGITSQDIPYLFEPFFTTKQVGEGTGLGLPQAYGIVKRHGGTITIDSTEHAGTTVTIRLPVTTTAPPTTETVKPPVSGQGETILLLEDDTTGVLQVLCSTLEYLGYRTLAANSLSQARQLYQQHASEIRLVIVDVTNPALHGTELLKLLPAENPSLKYLLFTDDFPGSEVEIPYLRPTAVNFLTKPWQLEDLAHAVKTSIISHNPTKKEQSPH